MHEFLKYIIKHNLFIQFLYEHIMSFIFRFVGLFVKTEEDLMLISSYGGERYDDSSKVLYEALLKDNRFSCFRFIWAFDNLSNFNHQKCPEVWNERTRIVKIDTLSYFLTALKAKVWITNVNIERGLHFKKRKTIYLNTWHGTGPKKSGNAVSHRKDYDFSNVDIFCVDGEYQKRMFIKWFNVTEEAIVWCGRPREDELFSFTQRDRERVKKQLNIEGSKKVILYMPTWREYKGRELNYPLWEKELKDDYVVLIRSHHFTHDHITFSSSPSWRNVSDYPNVNELYLIADILVSDYSSAFWDYALLGKPMFAYAYDFEQYKKSTGLLIDIEKEYPNGIQKDEMELLKLIRDMDDQEQKRKTEAFCKKYVSHPVNATSYLLDTLANKIHLHT